MDVSLSTRPPRPARRRGARLAALATAAALVGGLLAGVAPAQAAPAPTAAGGTPRDRPGNGERHGGDFTQGGG